MAKLVQNYFQKIFGHLNIFKDFGQTYSFAKIFVGFFYGESIWIFICDLFIMPNTFGYSFVQYLW